MPNIAKPTGILNSNLMTVGRFTKQVMVSDGCWEWGGYVTKLGYGQFTIAGTSRRAHRVMWELIGNAVDYKMQLDHLCRNRSCVRIDHLEQVTPRINTLRGESPTAFLGKQTECKHGHPFSGKNLSTKIRKSTGQRERVCLTCQMLLMRKRRAKLSATLTSKEETNP